VSKGEALGRSPNGLALPKPIAMIDDAFMTRALMEAEAAAARGEVPVGAVLMGRDGAMLAASGNRIVELRDPTAHAEILVIREAAAMLGNERLNGCDLYVTLEPCAMCAGAISFARLRRVVFAAGDPKGGAVLHGPKFFQGATCHHRPLVDHGVKAEESAELLRSFFRARRM
jgi:tRNA(adenine34) deaminase